MKRTGFPDCEREYNRREEEIEMAREERREAMSDTPRTDEIWGSMHGSGYQMMLLAQKLERELAEARRERDDKDGETFRMVVEHRLDIVPMDSHDSWAVGCMTDACEENADLATAVRQVVEKIKEELK